MLLPVLPRALVVLLLAACGAEPASQEGVEELPTAFSCRTWSLHLDPLDGARGVPSPEQAAAPYVPDGAAVVTIPAEPAGARDVTFLAYVDDELVARVVTANLLRGHGWWALSVRACS
jgi:hypothetical protein